MVDKLREWLSLLNRWWGIGLVYLSMIVTIYLGIWTAIEPLSIPQIIHINSFSIPRSILHAIITLLAAANLTLFLYMYSEWRYQNKRHAVNSYVEAVLKKEIPVPAIEQLLYEKVMIGEKDFPEEVFASRVLVALNAGVIEERFAHDLLRKSVFDIAPLNGIYTLTEKKVASTKRLYNV